MATCDFTETPVIDREIAARLNPFIGYIDHNETRASVRAGLRVISLAIASSTSVCESEASGLQLFADTLSAALDFENANKGGAL